MFLCDDSVCSESSFCEGAESSGVLMHLQRMGGRSDCETSFMHLCCFYAVPWARGTLSVLILGICFKSAATPLPNPTGPHGLDPTNHNHRHPELHHSCTPRTVPGDPVTPSYWKTSTPVPMDPHQRQNRATLPACADSGSSQSPAFFSFGRKAPRSHTWDLCHMYFNANSASVWGP